MRGTRPLTAALLVLACALPSGCGGSGPAADPAPSDAAASPSPSGPVAPALPDAARKHTKAGAVAFVRHYIDIFNYAQHTGDVTAMRELSETGCRSCRSVIRLIRKTYEPGGHAEGGTLAIDGIDAVPSLAHTWEVDISGVFSRSKVFPSRDARPETNRGGKVVASFYVLFEDDRWAVTRWRRVL